ncbi:hypothetical protein VNO77_04333 [Canavalia gladiata]|uniref:Uncharacterized protein n=1 Tax=Canavalia gladiata TaxID=3824 RepID=A0AAN9R4Q1_CANGL
MNFGEPYTVRGFRCTCKTLGSLRLRGVFSFSHLLLSFFLPRRYPSCWSRKNRDLGSIGVDGRTVTTSDHMLKSEFAPNRKIMVSEVLKMLIGSTTFKREDMFILEIDQQDFRLKPMIAQSSMGKQKKSCN